MTTNVSSVSLDAGSPTKGILDIRDVEPRSEADDVLFREVYEVLEKHKALSRYGVTLLHKHFDVADEEMLVEATDRTARVQTIRAIQKSELANEPVIETSWRLDTGYPLTTCVCVVSGSDHSHQNRHSDLRLKESISPLVGSLGTVMQLAPKTYYYRSDYQSSVSLPRGPQIGLVAQEVEQVLPCVVHEGKAGLQGGAFKSIDYISLIPVLIGAIQEQQRTLDRVSDLIASSTRAETGM